MTLTLPKIGEHGVPDPLTAPISAYRYADAKRKVKDFESRARPLIRLWDKDMKFIGRIGGEKSVDVEQRLHDTGTGSVVLRGSDWINKFLRTDVRANDDLNITIDPYPNNRNWRWRWGGKVTAVRNVRTEKGLHELHFDVAENREHWKHLYFAATPWFAPEFQPLKAWVLPGNTRTIVATTGFVNLARIFFPPLGVIDNFVNVGAWLKPLTDGRLWSPLNWPIQMQFVNPLTDTSRFSVIATRWSPAHDTTAGLLKDAGCNVRAYTWLEEDEDSPHPELAALIGQAAARPGRNCIVLAVEDQSGVVGLTGTAVDGAVNLVAATADDLISEILYAFRDADAIDPRTGKNVPPYVRDFLGIAPKLPSIVFRDSTLQSPIKSSERAIFKSTAKSVIVGGKSPGWVNQLQTFGIKYGLSWIQVAHAYGGGGPGAAVVGPAPLGSGLEEVYQGQFDNCCGRGTLIEGPDGDTPIEELAESGLPFRVWSLTPDGERVAATATLAFKKGRAQLFRYTVDDGRIIEVTGQHRFLTDCGYVEAKDIARGALVATVDHAKLSAPTASTPIRLVCDADYLKVPETSALQFRRIAKVEPLAVDDFYDMHVPGWENYSANGFWNHNTLLAFMRHTDPMREIQAGDMGYLEYFTQEGGGTAYTISSLLAQRQGLWRTRPYQAFKVSIWNRRPYSVFYDFDLGTRALFEIDGLLYTDQFTAIRMHYDEDTPKTFDVTIGTGSDMEDPMAQAVRTIQTLWSAVGTLFGSNDLF